MSILSVQQSGSKGFSYLEAALMGIEITVNSSDIGCAGHPKDRKIPDCQLSVVS